MSRRGHRNYRPAVPWGFFCRARPLEIVRRRRWERNSIVLLNVQFNNKGFSWNADESGGGNKGQLSKSRTCSPFNIGWHPHTLCLTRRNHCWGMIERCHCSLATDRSPVAILSRPKPRKSCGPLSARSDRVKSATPKTHLTTGSPPATRNGV